MPILKNFEILKTDLKIFVIDDNILLKSLIVNYLKKYKLQVLGFDSGEEAFENIHLKPNLIFVDYSMKEMCGKQFIEKTREINDLRHIPIVMMSAENVNVDNCYFLQKPFHIKVLDKFVDELLLQKHTQYCVFQSLLSENKVQCSYEYCL